jgi:biotin carboxyl carrier protein
VKKGDVLMILEAMKMENEIMAPVDGVVSAVSVTKGQTVETGALLCVIG